MYLFGWKEKTEISYLSTSFSPPRSNLVYIFFSEEDSFDPQSSVEDEARAGKADLYGLLSIESAVALAPKTARSNLVAVCLLFILGFRIRLVRLLYLFGLGFVY